MVASFHRFGAVDTVESPPSRFPRLSPARMYERFVASDSTYNGRFFTGVLTTGIYCLPSCSARKPKLENVRFFPSCEAARAAGLRPCKKCHPDDFARGADAVLESVETVVSELRAEPARFADARAVVRRLGFGTTRAFELFRQHFHSTPADLLTHARVALAARRLLETEAPLLEIAGEAGFESASVFHEQFRRIHGLTPAAYRALREPSRTGFELQLPNGYLLGYLRRALTRDVHSVNERLDGDLYTTAVRLEDQPAVLRLSLHAECVTVELAEIASSIAMPLVAAHRIVSGLLGLEEDAVAFARLARKLGLTRLVAGREHLRISRTHSIYDGLLWSIIGQQINFPFACLLKRRLFELTGTRTQSGLIAPPRPADVARLDARELIPLQFSRQKADYVISVSRLIADGKLDLEALRTGSATRAERTLLAVRGLGPWSVNYIMMRAFGFADCVPYGDTGVTSGLQSLLKLEKRPDLDATRRLMTVFSPHRSLATAHLWQLNHPIPV